MPEYDGRREFTVTIRSSTKSPELSTFQLLHRNPAGYPPPLILIFPKSSDGQFTFSFRNNAADVYPSLQKSSSLLPGSWESMTNGVDYSVSSNLNNFGQTIRTIDLLTPVTDEDHIFFRQRFQQIP